MGTGAGEGGAGEGGADEDEDGEDGQGNSGQGQALSKREFEDLRDTLEAANLTTTDEEWDSGSTEDEREEGKRKRKTLKAS